MKLIFVNKNTCAPTYLGLENFNDGVDIMEGQQVNFFYSIISKDIRKESLLGFLSDFRETCDSYCRVPSLLPNLESVWSRSSDVQAWDSCNFRRNKLKAWCVYCCGTGTGLIGRLTTLLGRHILYSGSKLCQGCP